MDFDQMNQVQCEKCLVEFLRVNATIAKRFGVSTDSFPVRDAGYMHYSLDHKLEVLHRITNMQVTACDDCTEHYEYFRDHFNPNPNDCCNLRK